MAIPNRTNILETYDQLCELIEKKLKISASLIYQGDSLIDDIGFTLRGLRAFTDNLVNFFGVSLKRSAVAKCKTVGDLVDLIVSKLP